MTYGSPATQHEVPRRPLFVCLRVTQPTCLAVLLVAAVVFAGCSRRVDQWVEGRPSTFPASGVVLLDGFPVHDAVVAFDSREHNLTAVGRTDDKGVFGLKTFEPGDGAAAGDHLVKITKLEVIGFGPEGEPLGEVNRLPAVYGDGRAGLEATVTPEGPNVFRFEIISDPNRKRER